MGSASRSALDAARSTLTATKGVSVATGTFLLTAARAIESSTQLRSVLADSSVDASAKARLLASVFAGFDVVALDTLAGLVASRWSTPSQMLDGIEEVGIRAVAQAAPKEPIEESLFAFGRLVASDAELELTLASKLGDAAAKAALVDTLIGSRVGEGAIAIVRHLVQSPRGRRIRALVATAADIVADSRGAVVARVVSATPLTPAQRDKLAASLAARHGRAIHLDLDIDPTVIGGVRVQIGDDVVDGTVAHRLADLRLQLAG